MSDIESWLERHGFGKYAEAFAANEVDVSVLPRLSEQDLKDLGLPLGTRRKLQAAIETILADNPSTPSVESRVSADQAERRQLTVMFCDLVGSVEFGERMDVEDYRDLLARFRDAVVAAVERYEGFVARHQGDGLLVYFGYPQAHENDAERAARAGLDVVGAVQALGHPYDLEPKVRIGIATGPAVVGDVLSTGASERSELAALGTTPNLAARLQAEAEPNTVMVSETTYALMSGLYEIETLPPRMLKGIAKAVTPHRLVAELRGRSRFAARSGTQLSPFVGREEELELLTRCWKRAREGQGEVVLVIGDAGIGKSRLLQWLNAGMDTGSYQTLVLQCSSFRGNSALWPVIAGIEQLLSYAEVSAPPARLASLQQHLEKMEWTDAAALGLLANLLSLPTEGRFPSVEAMQGRQRRARTLHTLVEYVRRRAARSPTLLAFEDIHWADPSTRELISRLVEAIEGDSVLMLCTARPGFEASWTDSAHVAVLNLPQLSRTDSARLVSAASGPGRQLSGEVVETIVSRGTGNPLFIEELTRMVSSSRDSPPMNCAAIPVSLQDFLMARLDALGAGKFVAQRGSVIGREFSRELLEQTWDRSGAELRSGLAELEESGLVHKRVDGEGARYTFKHALIEDAAYQSMLLGIRQRIHARIAARLETESSTRDGQPELLAHHHTKAGSIEAATKYWLRAGEHAASQLADREAIAHLTTVIELLESIPEQPERLLRKLDALLLLGAVHQLKTGWGVAEGKQAYLRAQALIDKLQLDDLDRRFRLTNGLRRVYNNHAQIDMAEETAQECLRIAECTGEALMLRDARYALGITCAQKGHFRAAVDHFELGARFEHGAGKSERSAWLSGVASCHAGVATYLWHLGFPEQAQIWCAKLIEFEKTMADPFFKSYYLSMAGFLALRIRDNESLRERAMAAQAISSENQIPLVHSYSMVQLGWLQTMSGDASKGCQLIRKGIALAHDSGSLALATWLQTLLAEACHRAGDPDAGLESVMVALRFEGQSGMRASASETRRVKGSLLELGQQTDDNDAEDCYREAIEIAQIQEAKSFELRASVSLARLLAATGRSTSALEVVKPIYAQFTEGFATADLREARQLIEELS